MTVTPLSNSASFIIYETSTVGFEIPVHLNTQLSSEFAEEFGYICDGEDVCKPCKRGYYKAAYAGVLQCVKCPSGGFYQDELAYTGVTVYGLGCKQCPRGSYVKPEMAPGESQSDCKSCEQGTDLKRFAKFRACHCMKDYYRLDRFGPCFQCKKGYLCTNESVDLAPGFYWVWNKNTTRNNYNIFTNNLVISSGNFKIRAFQGYIPDPHACPFADNCLGGSLSLCAKGYKGPLCAICVKGYTNVMAKCRPCPTLPWIIAQAVFFTFLIILIIGISIWKDKKETSDSSRSLSDIVIARFKIVIGFYQVSSSTFDSFSYISWPASILSMMKYVKVVQMNIFQMVSLDCINDNIKTGAYAYFQASLAITAVVFLAGPVITCCFRVLSKIKSPPEENLERKASANKLYRCLILILFITFPSTCTSVFQMLPAACHKICSYDDKNCKSYLKADYSVQCETAKHKIYGTLSTVALLYCTGFPLALFLILKRARGKLNNNSVILSSLRFLYENYSPICWFWEILELIRKMSFSAILILMNAESRISLGLTAILSGLYSIFFALYKPIEDKFEYWLQLISLMASSVNFTVGMLMKIPKEDSSSGITNEADELSITILLIGTNVTVIILITVQYLSSIVAKITELKKEPRCDVSCCLEVLQLVSEAHGEASSMCTEPKNVMRRVNTDGGNQGLSDSPSNIQDVLVQEDETEENNTATSDQKQMKP